MWRIQCVLLAILATGWVLLSSSTANAQIRFVAEAEVGGGGPVDGNEWHVGVTAGLKFGVGFSVGSVLITVPVGVSYGEAFREDVGAYGRVDVTMGPTVLVKLRPVLVGWRVAGLTRIASDPRNPVDPETGESMGNLPQVGMITGPVLWWPLRKWLALGLGVTWEYSAPVGDFEAYYWPEHTFGWSTGLVFTF